MPWRLTHDPYRILVSEIMLQQTQVSRVVPFYKNFIKQFPNFRLLAKAKLVDVLCAWQGLGYNRRALSLQKLAKEILEKYKGRLPRDRKTLESLPGIGSYTAGAIRAFAFNEPEIFIETNIRRVFIHFFFPRRSGVTDMALKRCIKRTLDRKHPREWYYGLMDYGAMLGVATKYENPNRRSAHYARQSKFAGSDRELRGKVLRILLTKKRLSMAKLPEKITAGLVRDGFIVKHGGFVSIKK